MKKRLLAILLIAMALLTACGYIVVEDPETITLGSLFMPTGFAEEEALPSYEGDAETETEEKLSLKAGSRGDEVKALQKMLREYGFLNGKDDGIYGKKTGEAVKQAKEYLKDEAD
ncbi:MAG: peptidoglycan-binding protein, partial [Clostridia bacterium]|nr:peptidoglycan-binding protein [Clostridia bacterium]